MPARLHGFVRPPTPPPRAPSTPRRRLGEVVIVDVGVKRAPLRRRRGVRLRVAVLRARRHLSFHRGRLFCLFRLHVLRGDARDPMSRGGRRGEVQQPGAQSPRASHRQRRPRRPPPAMTHAADRRCDIAAAETPATRRPVPSSAVSHGGGGQCAWVTTGPAGFAEAPPPEPARRSTTPDHPHARWNPSRPGSPGSCSIQCTALFATFPGPSRSVGTRPRRSVRSNDRSNSRETLFCVATLNAAARARVPPRRSHTCTIPLPVPANTVWPFGLTRTQCTGDFASVGATSSARGFPPAQRASQR